MARLTKYEQETVISFNEEETTASVYTYNQALQRKLNQLARERPQECVLDETRDYSGAVVCTIPKRWVKIAPNRILSEAEKEWRRQSVQKAILSKKASITIEKTGHIPAQEGNYTTDMGE